jgi:branched-chain amino acid transport system substrate-binding protein
VRCAYGRASFLLPVVASLIMTACAPVDGPADRTPDRAPVQVDESLGSVRVTPGAPILVRVVLDMTDDPEALGRIIEAAFRAAVEDFGALQQGFRVELGDVIATDCSRESGAAAGSALAEEAGPSGIVAVLGPQCTPTLLGLQGPAESAGLVVITPRPQEVALTEGADGLIGQDRVGTTWRTSPSRLREARAAAEYAIDELALVRAATIGDGGIESTALATAFRMRFESLGGTVVIAREVDEALLGDDEEAAESARVDLLDAIARAEVDVVFLPVASDGLVAVVEAVAGRPRLADITRITTSAAATATVLQEESALGLLIMGPVLDFPDAVSAITGMSASQTLERVSAEADVVDPAGWWAYAYDAATLLLKAIDDSSLIDVDGSFVLSRSELRQSVARTTFTGLTGQIGCTALGDCAPPLIAVREHDDPTATGLASIPLVARIEP